jgi:hypothetical protein
MPLRFKCCDPARAVLPRSAATGVFRYRSERHPLDGKCTGPMLPRFKCRLASRLRGNVRLGNLLHGMKPGAVLLLRLFYGTNLSAKGSELAKFLLDCLQTFMPLAVSDLSIGLLPTFLPILLVQPLNLRNLQTETPDLCS